MDHRPQLHDDINSGTIKLQDLDKDQLRGLIEDFTMDYQPDEPFVTRARVELEGRPRRKVKPIDRNFF